MLTSTEVTDDGAQHSDGEPRTQVPTQGYSAAVAVESQPPISCLIATRPWTFTVLVLAGLAVIAGLEAAFSNIFHGSGLPNEVITILNVASSGSLAAWFSSVLLSLAAVNAVLVYWLRSHKLDDYRARYRVWIWSAIGLTIAAIDANTGIHAVVGHLIANQFELPWLQNPVVNSVTVLTLVFGSLAVRLGFEIWVSRLARSWYLFAVVGYVAAILVHLDVLVIDSVMLTAMAESTAILLANLAVTLMVASYCRYVHLESQGALKPRRERRSKPASDGQRADGAETAERQVAEKPRQRSLAKPTDEPVLNRTLKSTTINSKSIRCDSAHQLSGVQQTDNQTSENASAAAAADASEMLDFDPETGAKLSKSARRRLRKQMRRQKKTGSG